jgi:hypothetical protein
MIFLCATNGIILEFLFHMNGNIPFIHLACSIMDALTILNYINLVQANTWILILLCSQKTVTKAMFYANLLLPKTFIK